MEVFGPQGDKLWKNPLYGVAGSTETFRAQAEELGPDGKPLNTKFWAFLGLNPGLEATDLLNQMLDPIAERRLGIEEVMLHPWFLEHQDDLDEEAAFIAMRRKLDRK